MKIGVYGGAFNPPHLGHITAARTVFELLKLDKLLVIPTGRPPHKSLAPDSPSPDQRLELTRLAMEQTGLEDRVEVLDLELRREGNSYTVDTLSRLRELYPGEELWLLLGAAVTAACLCTTLGTMLMCLLLGVTGLCSALAYRRLGLAVKTALCCAPALVYAALYFVVE